VFLASQPNDMKGIETIVLTEAYINSFSSNKVVFDMLHQYNRRTEGKILSMDFNPATAPPANLDYLKFVKYP
jgi:hypothetical protein